MLKVIPQLYNNRNTKIQSNHKSRNEQIKSNFASNNSARDALLVNNQCLYARYVVFRGSVTQPAQDAALMTSEIRLFLGGEVTRFLRKHEMLYLRNTKIAEKAEKLLKPFDKKSDEFSEKLREGFKPKELDIVQANMQRLLKKEQIVKEYSYLREKSQKYFVSDETSAYAESISGQMGETTNYLTHFSPLMQRYHRMMSDVRNGLADKHIEITSPELAVNKEAVQKAEQDARFNMCFYNDVCGFKKRAIELLKKPQQERPIEALRNFDNGIRGARYSMKNHEELLPLITQRADESENSLAVNAFSADTVDKAFQALETRYNRTIRRNVDNFKRYFNEHPAFIWNEQAGAETDTLLARQDGLNGKLWQMIEEDKNKYFSSESIKQRRCGVTTPQYSDGVPF